MELRLDKTTHSIVPVQQFSTPVAIHDPDFFSNSVFLAEDIFFPFFSPLNPRLTKPALFQRCSLSRVFDERVRNRALDRSAPLNAHKPSRVSRRKKLF